MVQNRVVHDVLISLRIIIFFSAAMMHLSLDTARGKAKPVMHDNIELWHFVPSQPQPLHHIDTQLCLTHIYGYLDLVEYILRLALAILPECEINCWIYLP